MSFGRLGGESRRKRRKYRIIGLVSGRSKRKGRLEWTETYRFQGNKMQQQTMSMSVHLSSKSCWQVAEPPWMFLTSMLSVGGGGGAAPAAVTPEGAA